MPQGDPLSLDGSLDEMRAIPDPFHDGGRPPIPPGPAGHDGGRRAAEPPPAVIPAEPSLTRAERRGRVAAASLFGAAWIAAVALVTGVRHDLVAPSVLAP